MAMDIKIKILLFVLGIFVFININSCKKRCDIAYVFDMPISIYPAKDTFMVGDTFYIEINTPTLMHNSDNNTYVNLAKHGIPVYIDTYLITDKDSNMLIDFRDPSYNNSIGVNRNFASQFDVLPIKGNINVVSSPYQPVLELDIENGNFVNKSAIIIKDTGLYYFQFRDYHYFITYHYANSHPDLNDSDCNEFWRQSKYYINEGESNSYLLKDRGLHLLSSNEFWDNINNHNLEHGSWSFVVKAK
jgi:hypothetical protein